MFRTIALIVIVFVEVTSASVTAAWKVSIEKIAPGFKDDAKVRKLDKLPGDSVFFKGGDELWDISGVLQIKTDVGAPFEEQKVTHVPWTGDWVVWNARSGMAIASGSRNDLLIAERIFAPDDDQVFFHTQLEWSRGAKAEVFRKLSGHWCLSDRTKIEVDGAEAELECWSMGSEIRVFFDLSWPGAEAASKWEISSGCVTREGKPTPLVSHGSGDERWFIHATISRELGDGTPLSERRSIEKEGKRQQWPPSLEQPDALPIDDSLSLVRYGVSSNFLSQKEDLPEIKEIEAPENLRNSVRGRFKDAKGFLRHYGVALKSPDSFAGYDPLLSVLVVIGEERDHETCRQITAGLGGHQYRNLQVDASLGADSFGLVCQAGMKSRITRAKGEVEDLVFEVEPGWGEESLDLIYGLDVTWEGRAPQRFASKAKFVLGAAKGIGRYRLPGGEEREVTLSVSDLQP
jgi:hypothetical protein